MLISKEVFIKVLRKLTSNESVMKSEKMIEMFSNSDG